MGSRGALGGVLLMWDRRVVEKIEECVGRYTIACSFKNVDDNFVWVFGGCMGRMMMVIGGILWDELVGLMSWWEMPWCFGGDFNVVRYPSEKSGASRYSPAMADFSAFIFEQGLLDIPLVGGILLGQIIRKSKRGLELIDFYYLWNGKNIFLM
jgi:hypothetical protein